MKNLIKLSIVVIFLFSFLSFSSCGELNNERTNSTEIQQNTNDSDNEKQPKADVLVTVTEKNNIPKNVSQGQYSDRVEFVFELKNLTSKNIKGIQGTLTVYDLFDKKITCLSTKLQKVCERACL